MLINLKYRLQAGLRGAFGKPLLVLLPAWILDNPSWAFTFLTSTRLLSSNPFAEPSSSSLVAKRYFVRERSKECKLLLFLFGNRFTSPRNGDSPSLSVESKQLKRMLSWNLMAQTSSTAPDHGPLAVWRTIFSQE